MTCPKIILCLAVLDLILFGSVPAFATSSCPMTPENPSLVLFLAGSAAMGYQYIRARFF